MVEVLNNPDIQRAVKAQESKDGLRAALAESLMSTKTWADMDERERKVCKFALVSDSETEDELRAKLTSIGIDYFEISWHQVDENDKTDLEARMFVKALGGLVSKSGALVMIMTMDDAF